MQHPTDYQILIGDVPKPEDCVIVQFYNIPYDNREYHRFDTTQYYCSKVGLYRPNFVRLCEAYDGTAHKDPIVAEYNALVHGLTAAIKMGVGSIVLHTNSDAVLNRLSEDCLYDSESEPSVTSCSSTDVDDLHEQVMDMIYEMDAVGFKYITIEGMVAFENYVTSMMQMNAGITRMNMQSGEGGHMSMID